MERTRKDLKPEEMMVGEVYLDHEEYGLEESIANAIERLFAPQVSLMTELEPEFETVMAKIPEGPPSEEHKELASDLLKKYVKVRTGTATAHKEAKAPFLSGGRFVDGLKNAQAKASAERESALKAVVDYDKNAEKERLARLGQERMDAIAPYLPDGAEHVSYAGMPEPIWNQYLKSARSAQEERQKNKDKTPLALAVETLTNALKEEGGLWDGYKANIAMAIYDEVGSLSTKSQAKINAVVDLHKLCNQAAERFLQNWTHKPSQHENYIH